MDRSVTIKKKDREIFYSVSGDRTHFLDLKSIELKYPDMADYLSKNHLMLERKMLQFKEEYGYE